MTRAGGPDDGGESQRQRDLVIQVQRFLKYAPKGTAKDVLVREAQNWDRRLEPIQSGVLFPVIKRLRADLRRLQGGHE